MKYVYAKEFDGEVWVGVAHCGGLAVMPLRELTDAEVDECWRAYVSYPHYKQSILGVIAKADEIRARPAEPETVPFDCDKWFAGGWQLQYKLKSADAWEDTKSLELGYEYRMRRKP